MREIKSRDADEQQRDYEKQQRDRAYWAEHDNGAWVDGCGGSDDRECDR